MSGFTVDRIPPRLPTLRQSVSRDAYGLDRTRRWRKCARTGCRSRVRLLQAGIRHAIPIALGFSPGRVSIAVGYTTYRYRERNGGRLSLPVTLSKGTMTKRVLIVGDNKFIRQALSELFKSEMAVEVWRRSRERT